MPNRLKAGVLLLVATPALVLALTLALALTLTQSVATAAPQTLSGTATYLARIAVPPGAAFEATLEQISDGAAPLVLGRFIQMPAGNPPYRFEIGYGRPAAPRLRLSVRLIDSQQESQRVLFSATRDLDTAALPGPALSLVMGAGAALAPPGLGADPSGRLSGLYDYISDSGSIKLCGSAERLPVATEGDNAALERAYGNTRRNPGESLLVELRGHILERLPLEGPLHRVLIVDNFISIQARDNCPERVVLSGLTNTYWKLSRLGDITIAPQAGKRQAHLILKAERVTGSGGCNNMAGSYTLDGESLKFGQIAGTKMACAAGMDEEAQLHSALARVARWKINGKQLDLLDMQGNSLARLEVDTP